MVVICVVLRNGGREGTHGLSSAMVEEKIPKDSNCSDTMTKVKESCKTVIFSLWVMHLYTVRSFNEPLHQGYKKTQNRISIKGIKDKHRM